VGGKTRTGSDGEVAKGWDHDPPAKAKLVHVRMKAEANRHDGEDDADEAHRADFDPQHQFGGELDIAISDKACSNAYGDDGHKYRRSPMKELLREQIGVVKCSAGD